MSAHSMHVCNFEHSMPDLQQAVCSADLIFQGVASASVCLALSQVHMSIAQVPFQCDTATVVSVRSEFQSQLQPVLGYSPQTSDSLSTVIDSVGNATAWRYLGCLPEIISLVISIYDRKSVKFSLTLPAEWGLNGSFPNSARACG